MAEQTSQKNNEPQVTAIETIHTHTGKKDRKGEESINELQENFKWSNIHIIEVLEDDEREKQKKISFEKITADISPNLMKTINPQI